MHLHNIGYYRLFYQKNTAGWENIGPAQQSKRSRTKAIQLLGVCAPVRFYTYHDQLKNSMCRHIIHNEPIGPNVP